MSPAPSEKAVRILLELEEEYQHHVDDLDLLDVDKLLKACGYECFDYGDTLLYRKPEWGSTLTFPRFSHSVPKSRVVGLLRMVRRRLEQGELL